MFVRNGPEERAPLPGRAGAAACGPPAGQPLIQPRGRQAGPACESSASGRRGRDLIPSKSPPPPALVVAGRAGPLAGAESSALRRLDPRDRRRPGGRGPAGTRGGAARRAARGLRGARPGPLARSLRLCHGACVCPIAVPPLPRSMFSRGAARGRHPPARTTFDPLNTEPVARGPPSVRTASRAPKAHVKRWLKSRLGS